MREHLIVVIPGIGGSVLAPPGRPDTPLWSLALSDTALLAHPERLSLDETPVLEPVQLIRSVKVTRFWTAVPGYEALLTMLADMGTPPELILEAPYDFRRSMVDSAAHVDALVSRRLGEVWPGQDHAGRVIVVAHSMGGLVARYWLGPGGAAPRCKVLITLGTPHMGAPKALDVLANGVAMKGRHVLRSLRNVLRTWPSMVELLPRYRAVVDRAVPGSGGDAVLRYPYELDLPWGADPRAAYERHRAIAESWATMRRDATTVVPRIGYGHGTMRACAWDGRRVRVTRAVPGLPEYRGWDHDLGDGTVPAYCGLPAEMLTQPPEDFLVNARHGRLGTLAGIASLIGGYEKHGNASPFLGGTGTGSGKPRPPVLGLDVEETQVAGEPFEITAAIRGTGVDPPVVAVWAAIAPVQGAAPPLDVRLVWDGEAGLYRGEIPGLAAGAHSLTVTTREVPRIGDLTSSAVVEALGDDELD